MMVKEAFFEDGMKTCPKSHNHEIEPMKTADFFGLWASNQFIRFLVYGPRFLHEVIELQLLHFLQQLPEKSHE